MLERFFLPLLVFMAAACEPEATHDCPGPRPAFRLQIRAESGQSLPGDMIVRVRYGGNGEESFRADAPSPQPQVLFCGALGGAAGAAGAGSAAGATLEGLACELWTDGAADVTIEASGFEAYEEPLAATTDRCGVQTTLKEILLTPG